MSSQIHILKHKSKIIHFWFCFDFFILFAQEI
jgi:hypothetical protein